MTNEYDSTYDELEFRERPWTVTCVHCKRTDYASQMNLERIGWALSNLGEYCPKDECQQCFERERQNQIANTVEKGWAIV